jgi:23S rRNA-/tRNA-specific pseudouridylate synthase
VIGSLPGGRVPIPVLAGGDGWLALEKPWGMSVHNRPGEDLLSIVWRSLADAGKIPLEADADSGLGVHPVHRLDRETSGVAVFAYSAEALRNLGGQFARRTIKKRYLALLHGPMPYLPEGVWGEWNWPLSREAGGRRNPAGRGRKTACRTRYRVLGRSRHYSLVACEPITGRTHQIRRHAKLAGHPVTGDGRYGSMRAVRFLQAETGFFRLGLHAHRLTLLPPGEVAEIRIESRGLPPEIHRLYRNDGGASGMPTEDDPIPGKEGHL